MSQSLFRICFREKHFKTGSWKFVVSQFSGRTFSTKLNSTTLMLSGKNSINTSQIRFASSISTTWVHELYCDARPVLFLKDVFQNVHDFTGLPWWSTIVITVLGLRLCTTLPLTVYQHYVLAKYENLQPELAALSKELMMETAIATKKFNLNEKTARYMFNASLRKHRTNLIIRDNCHPFKASLLVFVQIPLWFSQSLSLRNMVCMLPTRTVAAELTFIHLTFGGTLWFSNLTYPDTTWILPILMGLINLSIIELHVLRKAGPPSKLQKIITNIFRVVTVIMVPVAATVPSCLAVSWLSSSTYGLAQNIILLQPKVRRFCRIPKTPSESSTPFRDVLKNLKMKLKIDK